MTVDNSRFSYYNPGEYLDRAALAAASTEVGAQVATQSDLEDLLPNYGVQYMPTSGGASNTVYLPFRASSVTPRGCSYREDSGITMNVIGLWRVEVTVTTMVNPGSSAAAANVMLQVFNADGSLTDEMAGLAAAPANVTSYNTITLQRYVIVDTPGFYVRVYQQITSGNPTVVTSYVGQRNSSLSAEYIYKG